MAKREAHRDFLDALIGEGLTEFGSVILKEKVHELLGIEVPEMGTMKQFNQIALIELAAIDYARNYLLGEGKYLAGTLSGYRVLLPSENAAQIEAYVAQADKKLSRALKLSRNTPKQAGDEKFDQQRARVLMKQEGLRQRFS